ncbi:META domain-containing protein [Flavivirga sp. 57AJ16]|uniref:META domain-containing protein n=1 Tax=Flavivirga sp. 57AJ16 TaxID=3025307 RepID=UPI002365653E|nr:META domain-containing protein [Flavivirga sp. 57AJ16]MDD7886527.1 META domain-containing protein [Flavivirga sp. 57AJ16]
MKRFVMVILCIGLVISSCGDKKTEKKNSEASTKEISSESTAKINPLSHRKTVTNVYFKANGTEPFWSLTISEKMIKLKTIDDSIMTPHTLPELAQDANIKLYKLHTEMAKMNIQINQLECINAMSGMASPYSVDIEYMKGRETEFTKLEGCGEYIIDYRLHDLWVLETLNGNEITKESFKKDLPSMEINAASKSFTGYAGCNRMNGELFFEFGVLRFTDISTTKMMCGQNNLENEFLMTLKSTTSYKIENNRLWLSNASGQLLVFKKID